MKKLISLMLVAILTLSLVVVAGATEPVGTLTIANVDTLTTDSDNPNGYYAVDITANGFPEYKSYEGNFKGYNTATIFVIYDKTKLEAGYLWGGDVYYETDGYIALPGYKEGRTGVTPAASTGEIAASVESYDETHDVLKLIVKEGAIYFGNYENERVATICFRPLENAKGKTDLVFGDISFGFNGTGMSTAYGISKHDNKDFTLVNGSIDLGGEEEPDEPIVPDEPVATTVKTFAKRLYVDNTLYTVGVISEGTNYATEVIKAGINIEKGDATVNYWAADDAITSNEAGTSYYVVGLKDVKDTTDITVNSKSKAIITVNGGAIIDANDAIGAEKTDLEVTAE